MPGMPPWWASPLRRYCLSLRTARRKAASFLWQRPALQFRRTHAAPLRAAGGESKLARSRRCKCGRKSLQSARSASHQRRRPCADWPAITSPSAAWRLRRWHETVLADRLAHSLPERRRTSKLFAIALRLLELPPHRIDRNWANNDRLDDQLGNRLRFRQFGEQLSFPPITGAG